MHLPKGKLRLLQSPSYCTCFCEFLWPSILMKRAPDRSHPLKCVCNVLLKPSAKYMAKGRRPRENSVNIKFPSMMMSPNFLTHFPSWQDDTASQTQFDRWPWGPRPPFSFRYNMIQHFFFCSIPESCNTVSLIFVDVDCGRRLNQTLGCH